MKNNFLLHISQNIVSVDFGYVFRKFHMHIYHYSLPNLVKNRIIFHTVIFFITFVL